MVLTHKRGERVIFHPIASSASSCEQRGPLPMGATTGVIACRDVPSRELKQVSFQAMATATTTPENNDLIGSMWKNNRAPRAAGTLVQNSLT